MLPGNIYADPTITRYHKTQLLGVKDGAIQGKSYFRQLSVSTQMADALHFLSFCRKDDYYARIDRPISPPINARRRSSRSYWRPKARTVGERRRSEDCTQVAEARQTGKFLFKWLLDTILRPVFSLFYIIKPECFKSDN